MTPKPGLPDRLRLLALAPKDWIMRLVSCRYRTFLWGFSLMQPRAMEASSRLRGQRAFMGASRRVPAYAGLMRLTPGASSAVPETDKENYVKKYPIEERCRGGAMPAAATTIDESSGSTGTPYNWVRCRRERAESQRTISHFARYCFGSGPRITINAFSMGAWATGLTMGQALESNGIVKNTGPDLAKILSTLRFFGPSRPYLLLGYPPFVKHFVDAAEAEGFPWKDYRLDALVGGEGMSEELRDYLLRRFRRVYSGYGATDLEIGIAGETPVAVAVRRLAWRNPPIKDALFGPDSRLPMLFQYNPLMHLIEVNANRELLFTINRGSVLSPRIRYNVHDEGGVARFDILEKRLRAFGVELKALAGDAGPTLRLPFVWVYGRRDSTISVMGANIYPEDVEQSLYADQELARMTRSFCLSVGEREAQVRPCLLFEIDRDPSEELRARFARAMLSGLERINADFRAALGEYPDALQPEIRLYGAGEGPFSENRSRIKQVRLIRAIPAAARG